MSTFNNLWLRWKMLRLPWRKKFLIGQDLHGNTYWELVRALPSASSTISARPRRIMRPARKASKFHSDIQISPAWHQWLRQTRIEPPTAQEQHADLARQHQLKINARLADQRWDAKKKYFEVPEIKEEVRRIERPGKRDLGQAVEGESEDAKGREGADAIEGIAKGDVQPPSPRSSSNQGQSQNTEMRTSTTKSTKTETQENPWKKADETAANPGNNWQPQAWTPGSTAKRQT